MRKILLFVLCTLLALSLCACTDDSGQGTSSGAEVSSSAAEPSSAAPDGAYGKGDTAETGGAQITFLDVSENEGSDFFKPADGKVYLLCEFEIVNTSDEELVISSMMCFDCYVDDVQTTISLSALSSKEDKNQLDGTIASGKKMIGVLGYEVPSDWKTVEIHFAPDLLSSDKLIFTASK